MIMYGIRIGPIFQEFNTLKETRKYVMDANFGKGTPVTTALFSHPQNEKGVAIYSVAMGRRPKTAGMMKMTSNGIIWSPVSGHYRFVKRDGGLTE